eukprot:CAMPEP_0194393426 /NCGR_PEP_ID=MMETSP0174-20130528/123290_1 /TAXON_ID=216777 /ORGANISM="Proboscia alata, Strain PI-D3" /LENGTH=579 /DNA_ID=CAMNT_0039189107 /DNA_START=202 /DNA_END=1937 /DNA_ORIENTATION=+
MCTEAHDISEEDCIAAATLVGGKLREGNIVVGDWPFTPHGCFIQASDKAIHYGSDPDGYNDGRFQPVCLTPVELSTLLQKGKGMKCSPGNDFSKDDCITAARSLGGTLRNGHFVVGEWSHTPYGCFVEGDDKAIHFGTHFDGINNGAMEPICKAGLDKAWLLPAPFEGLKCNAGYDFSKDDCVTAALSVGGKLRNGKFIVGDWLDKPPGCFLELKDKAIHFGTNPDGINNNQFQPVCVAKHIKAGLLPAGRGIACSPELEIPLDDCVAAGKSLGGFLRNDIFLVRGHWVHTPPGCFLQDRDKAIHFNMNFDTVNNGQFQPVCLHEAIEASLAPHLHKGAKCTPGYDMTVDECILAGVSVGGKLRRRKFLVGNWANAPYGCFLEARDKAIHFGTNENGFNNGRFLPVCKPEPLESTLLPGGQGSKCTQAHDFAKEDCVEAAILVGGKLLNGDFLTGDWSNAPYGCFIDPSDGNAIHYGTDMNGINTGVFQPVCKIVAAEASLLPAQRGNECSPGHEFTQEDCVMAAKSVGGVLRKERFILGDWHHTPYGCFIEAKDKAIHFNSNPLGKNNGRFQPVCIYS